MLVRTPSDLGAIIRERRLKLGLDQLSLAKKADTSRKWIIEVENGKPRAEFGLILRTLKALGLELAASPAPVAHQRTAAKKTAIAQSDIDSILDSLKRRK
jgi:HTH-type transcriptional regulator/antitoxin HipB